MGNSISKNAIPKVTIKKFNTTTGSRPEIRSKQEKSRKSFTFMDKKSFEGVSKKCGSLLGCDFSERTINKGITPLIVLYDFKGEKNEDLSVKKGDKLILKGNSDPYWWYCESEVTKKSGFVPSNYVRIVNDINDEPWYFGSISKHVSEKHLLKSTVIGTFLVRYSYDKKSPTSSYTMSVYDGTLMIKHYRIKQTEDHKFYISLTAKFSTIEQLVTYYRLYISDELCVALTNFPLKLIPSLSVDDNTWYVTKENFKFVEIIGTGNFGQVWKAVYKNKYFVAVKMFKLETMTLDQFLNEANIMKKLNHPNLVDLLAICCDHKPMFIVMEYMENGSLLEFLKAQNPIILPIHKQVNIFKQISNGMSYLEANDLVHRDLAARNILVSKELKFKIADFGLTNFLLRISNSCRNPPRIPLRWSAPEIISIGEYSSKSDVWSFGIVMYEVATNGAKPYGSLRNNDILPMLNDGYRLSCPKNCKKALYQLMTQCWNQDPNKRPSFVTLSSFFQEFNLNNV